MSRYETYKETDVIWFKELPAHWKRKRVKDVTQTLAGGTPDTSKEEYWEGNIPWLPSGKVQNSIINEEDADTFITEEGIKNSATKMLPAPATLIALTGATCSNIGYLTFNACANQSVVGMPGSSKMLSKFLFYTLQSQKEQILLHQTGGAQGGISESDVKFLFVPVPTENEQLTIANYLDDQTQKIDRLIANKKAQAEKLKELRQIEINNAVTKGLNPNAEMKDSGIEWLGKIPKHWEVKRLKNVADINSTKQELHYEEVKDLEVVFLAMESVSENGQIDNSEKRPVSELWEGFTYFQKNDVIIAKITPCFENGKGAWLNNLESDFGFGSTEFHTVRGHKKRLDNHYFYHVTKSDVFMKIGEAFMTGSAGQKRVSTNFVLTFKLAFPPIEEQIEIANYLKERTTAIDQLIKNIEAQIEKLQELRKIKIYEAVTGKIKVNAYAETTA